MYKVTSDGYVMRVIPRDKTEKIIPHIEVYRLNDDETETLLEKGYSTSELETYGIEVGHLSDIIHSRNEIIK